MDTHTDACLEKMWAVGILLLEDCVMERTLFFLKVKVCRERLIL